MTTTAQIDQLRSVVADAPRFLSVFAQWVERPSVSESDRLVDDLGLGSLDLLYLLDSIETLVSVPIQNELLDTVVTVGDVRQLLAQLLAQTTVRRPGR